MQEFCLEILLSFAACLDAFLADLIAWEDLALPQLEYGLPGDHAAFYNGGVVDKSWGTDDV
jgi:hypothetical protein